MIPVRLALRNFLCYRDNVPPLDFEGIHVACLSGDNGHGKSALLDAITWALWGQARAKTDDELVHASATDMEVQFQFIMDGALYQVLRKQAKARSPRESGHTSLELQVAHAEDMPGRSDVFRSLSGSSLWETQKKIRDLLRMDYQTFINSAFLLQGRADEFTKKGPAERKKVLADILGLSYYDSLEGRAKEEAKGRESRGAELKRIVDEMEEELSRRPQWEEQLQRAQQDLQLLEGQARAQEAALNALREEHKGLELKKEELDRLEEELSQARGQLQQLEAQRAQHQARIDEYAAVLAHEEEVKEGYTLFLSARQENEELNQKLARLVQMNEVKAGLEKAIEEARTRLLTQEKVAESLLEDLEPKAASLPSLEDSLAEAQQSLEALANREAAAEEQRRQIMELAGEIQALRAENQKLHIEMQELKEKVDLLDKGQARCPVCETEVGEVGLRTIRDKYTREGMAKKEEYLSRQKLLQELAAKQSNLQREVGAEEAALKKDRESAQRRLASLERALAEAQEAGQRAASTQESLEAVRQKLARGDYASKEQGELGRLFQELSSLDYRPEKHQELRRRLEELAPFEERHRRLEEALRLLPQEEEAEERVARMVELWHQRIQENGQRMVDLRAQLERLPQVAQSVVDAQESLEGLRGREGTARLEVGACSQRLEHCDRLAQQRQGRLEELAKVEEERAIYQELAAAFGKKGIQAMIIEEAIPELEEKANALLSRMTDNRMHLKIETQRDTKKGSTLETLDIRIQDERGTRNYELFSGGEQFRINFALRIALSKMLARRAGAQLRMLVIDEGFGTQDTQGKERLVEAINSIQDDFDKVLVITHIQELKDLFPVRIEVVKTGEGSTYYVSA